MRWKKLIVRNLPFDATCAEAVGLCGYPLPATIDADAPLSEPSLKEVQAACPAFYRFEAGKPTKNGMPAMPARLYLHFRKDPDELLKVLAALNGKAVESSSGVAAVLEAAVAPNQKLPREKRRRDNKVNTYERDPEFVVFLEELENPTVPEPMVGDGDDAEAKPVPALVKFLNERRSKAKLRGASTMFGRNGKPLQKPNKPAQKGKSKKTVSNDVVDTNGNAAADTTKTGQRKQRERRRKDRAPVVDEPKMELQPGMFRIMPKAAPTVSVPAPPLPPPLPAPLNASSMSFEMPPAPTDDGGRGGRGRSRSGRGKKPKPEGGRGGGEGSNHRGNGNGNGGRGDGNGGRGDGNGGRGDGNGGRGQGRRSNKGPKNAPPLPTS